MKASATQPETVTISAAEFKAKCLQLMDKVVDGKLVVIVTKRGKPVMQAIAPQNTSRKPFRPVWGRSPQTRTSGDIMAPLFTEGELDSMGNISADE